MTHMLIIGGSDAGISAALHIKELDIKAQVTVAAADAYPNFSICGLPFYLSGEVADWRTLAHRTVQEIETHGIHLLLDHRAEKIDAQAKVVQMIAPKGEVKAVPYDRLLVATGAESARPPIQGLDVPGVFFLRWMTDSFAVKQFMDQVKPQRAVVVGGGYIGLEMADALTHRGLVVTLMEFAPEVLTTLDPELGRHIREELQSKEVRVVTGAAVQSIVREQGTVAVKTVSGQTTPSDMVVVAAGAIPSTALARTAGIGLGVGGAIRVDRAMATGVADIWAAGDCVET
ncbi:MAG: FAD-dependent oxidoreductase, partial [Desulfobacterales bacterium]|nr:FAD-dependent oxidoreductase [Desulfobacterales bacterium]